MRAPTPGQHQSAAYRLGRVSASAAAYLADVTPLGAWRRDVRLQQVTPPP